MDAHFARHRGWFEGMQVSTRLGKIFFLDSENKFTVSLELWNLSYKVQPPIILFASIGEKVSPVLCDYKWKACRFRAEKTDLFFTGRRSPCFSTNSKIRRHGKNNS